jgi:oligo-1,6-glucosidase/alpha-glucosidase
MKRCYGLFFFLLRILSIEAQQVPWYQHTSIYQIYPRSFYDSDGDGIGDIKGIISKLDYIKSLGFETIWCSPFFSSPQADFGYDIANFRQIAPEYGTLYDAEDLIEAVHQRGMRIIFDMVMNHTSDKHPWFERDIKRQSSDFYIWANKKNNWKGVAGSGWTWNKERKQYYYSAFLPFQPDLNYRNPEVKQEMLDNVRFWLKKGIDGYRLDIFNSIYEDSLLRNNPGRFKPIYTVNRPESLKFAEELRAVCDSFGDKLLLGEIIGSRSISRKYCGDSTNNRLGLAFDFEMLRFRFNARYFRTLILNLEQDFPSPFMPTYVFSNHDRRRSNRRLNNNIGKAKLLQFLQFTVRGVPCLYYGEELGMTDFRMSYRKALDPIPHYLKIPRFLVDMAGETLNRDEIRTPMQWNNSANAGFSTSTKIWLPVNPNFIKINVAVEEMETSSLLNLIRKVLLFRNASITLKAGTLTLLEMNKLPKSVLAFERKFDGERRVILLNFNRNKQKISLSGQYEKELSIYSEDSVDELSAWGAIIVRPVK